MPSDDTPVADEPIMSEEETKQTKKRKKQATQESEKARFKPY